MPRNTVSFVAALGGNQAQGYDFHNLDAATNKWLAANPKAVILNMQRVMVPPIPAVNPNGTATGGNEWFCAVFIDFSE